MTTLLILRVNGEVIARCDARCYDAQHEEHCVCVCLGRNHGVGFVTANNQSISGIDELTKEAKKKHGRAAEVECKAAAYQLNLFSGL